MYQITDIATVIENAGLGQYGVDLFTYYAPPEVASSIILFPSADPPVIDPELPYYYKGKFQIVVRNEDYDIGLELCKQLSETLTIHNTQVGNTFIKMCRPLYQPRVFRRSESGVLEMSITFDIRFVEK
jgi:hypothetical protein